MDELIQTPFGELRGARLEELQALGMSAARRRPGQTRG